mmetsp:Transcript_45510/g.74441  ORF Transcript_45510/g.74441 Transcript_45510/m.74441 type:complete len:86 (-) Transcript_45510:223-480(-)
MRRDCGALPAAVSEVGLSSGADDRRPQRFRQPSEHTGQSGRPGGVCQGDAPTGVLGCLAEGITITGTFGSTQRGAFHDTMFSPYI